MDGYLLISFEMTRDVYLRKGIVKSLLIQQFHAENKKVNEFRLILLYKKQHRTSFLKILLSKLYLGSLI